MKFTGNPMLDQRRKHRESDIQHLQSQIERLEREDPKKNEIKIKSLKSEKSGLESKQRNYSW